MSYWQEQKNTPLYPDVIWSRPETKHGAGKLLLIGGNEHGFAHVAAAYSAAEQSRIGTTRIIVPDSLTKITKDAPNIEYAPSNPSGGFARSALATIIEASQWADGVMLCGDMGKNSETVLLFEEYINRFDGLLIIDHEAHSSHSFTASSLLSSENRIIIWDLDQLRRAVMELQLPQPVTSDIGKPQLAEIMHEVSKEHPATIVVSHQGTWIAHLGKVTSSETKPPSARMAVWALQQPSKRYQALVSALALD